MKHTNEPGKLPAPKNKYSQTNRKNMQTEKQSPSQTHQSSLHMQSQYIVWQ